MGRWLAGLALALALVACAEQPAATPEETTRARTLEPAAGRALIYVYRVSTPAGTRTPAVAFVRPEADGASGGAQSLSLREKSFGVVEVPAGPVHLTLIVTHGTSTETYNTNVTVATGSRTYVEAHLNPTALIGRGRTNPWLYVRTAEAGTAAVALSRLEGVVRFGAAEGGAKLMGVDTPAPTMAQ